MKAYGRVATSLLAMAVVASLAGCSKSATNAMSESGTAATTSAASSAMATGASLYTQLGGANGVKALAESFGAKIAANSTLSKFFDAAAIAETQLGLVNEVAKASGMAPPNPGANLMSTLSSRGLDAAGVNELTNTLSAAADDAKIGDAQKTALMGLMAPVTSALLSK